MIIYDYALSIYDLSAPSPHSVFALGLWSRTANVSPPPVLSGLPVEGAGGTLLERAFVVASGASLPAGAVSMKTWYTISGTVICYYCLESCICRASKASRSEAS